jgi:hypothetical protein
MARPAPSYSGGGIRGMSESPAESLLAKSTVWTQARVELEGRSAVVARSAGGRLPQLVQLALQSQGAPMSANDPVTLRIELAIGSRVLGTLELGATQGRWVPVPGEGQPLALRPDAELLQALLEEARRTLR